MRKLLVCLLLLLVLSSCDQEANDKNSIMKTVDFSSSELNEPKVEKDALANNNNNNEDDTYATDDVDDTDENESNEESEYKKQFDEVNLDELPINRASIEKYRLSDEGVLVIEPFLTDDIHVDSASINQFNNDMIRAAELQKEIDNGKSFTDYSSSDQEILVWYERGIDPWYVGESCGWGCAFWFEEFISSSELQSQNENTYELRNIYDDSVSTCWSEGVNGNGIGESFELVANTNMIPRLIAIYNGYSKSVDTFNNNNRVKTLELTINDDISVILELEDVMGEQLFVLEDLIDNEEDFTFKFEILEIYKGEKYDDTCISEIKIRDGH